MGDEMAADTVTAQGMCEEIARWAHAAYGLRVSPEAIWNSAPGGEMIYIAELYAEAKAYFGGSRPFGMIAGRRLEWDTNVDARGAMFAMIATRD